MLIRFDEARVRLGATPVAVRPGGYREYEGVATYGDVVLEYPEDGWNEFVPASTALDPETVRLTAGVPFTVLHPDDLLDAQDEDSIKDHTEGVVLWSEARPEADPPEMRVRVLVYTASAQEAIESGRIRDLSLGYERRAEDRAGVHMGKAYQKVQVNRRPNHLSAVLSARSTTPDGRRARLDASPDAPAASPYAHGDTMEDDLIDTDQPRSDADVVVEDPAATALAMFSPEAIEILKTLPESDMKVLTDLVLVGKGEAAEQAVIEAEAGAGVEADVDDATTPAAPEALTMDAVKTMVADMLKAAGVGGGKMDGTPKPAASVPAATKTQPARPAESRVDAAEVAQRAAAIVSADRAFVDKVRASGARCDSVKDATTHALAVIKTSAPSLVGLAERALKEGRRDDFAAMFDAAEDARRADLLGDQFLVLEHAQERIASDRLGSPTSLQGLTAPPRAAEHGV